MSFTVVAKPALNKEGFAKLTFKGHITEEAVFDKTTGEQTRRAFVKLCFEAMDTTRKSPIKMNVVGGALTGRFLTCIEALGYTLPRPELALDSDGFEVETTGQVDDDGFEIETVDSQALIDELENPLDSARGKTFVGKVGKNQKGFWEIEVESLKPLK